MAGFPFGERVDNNADPVLDELSQLAICAVSQWLTTIFTVSRNRIDLHCEAAVGRPFKE